jgi:DNA-binding NarL/FixJ family response regulator
MMRVLLVDDHRLVIEGISNLLFVNGIEVVGIANDGLEAIALAKQLRPDLILMDVRMPRCDGLSATRQIKALQPDVKIVMLTTSTESQDLFEAVKSGACGYLLKTMDRETFIQALRDAESGSPPFSPGLASQLLDEFARLSHAVESAAPPAKSDPGGQPAQKQLEDAGLTERQAEVLRLVALGLTYEEVAEQLSLSERTVRYQMTKIMDRLHLYNRAQVLAYAGSLGLKPAD